MLASNWRLFMIVPFMGLVVVTLGLYTCAKLTHAPYTSPRSITDASDGALNFQPRVQYRIRQLDSLRASLAKHQTELAACKRCPGMLGPPVFQGPVISPVMLVGQAPGFKEIEVHRPFAWTAGKTLFKWFAQIGMEEQAFRERVYMAAMCRCFPGKNPKGGDRVPNPEEVTNCEHWLRAEVALLRPRLIIPAGKLAISAILGEGKLDAVVGCVQRVRFHGHVVDVAPLPHPSGASTWHRTEPGKTLLTKALRGISIHEAWRSVLPAGNWGQV